MEQPKCCANDWSIDPAQNVDLFADTEPDQLDIHIYDWRFPLKAWALDGFDRKRQYCATV